MQNIQRWGKKISLGVILGVFLFFIGQGTAAFFAREAGESSGKGQVVMQKSVALTFDDGPHEKWTSALLDGLKDRGVKATF